MKICSRCKIEKEDTDFRIRRENRRGYNFSYLNNTCRKCDSAIAADYFKKIKDDPAFKKKNSDRQKEYMRRDYGKYLSQQRERKAKRVWKNYMRNYNQRNKETIAAQNLLRNRKYVHDIIKNIKPTYIVRMLSHPREGIPAAVTRNYPEFIKTYQTHIAIKRLLKTKNNKEWTISYNSERLL